jgi:hypothetical protein
MKKVPFLIIFSISSMTGLSAQEIEGIAAAEAAETSSSNWQNWVFAGSALISAAVGVVIVSTNTGTFGH